MAASGGTVLDAGLASGYGLWVRIQHPDGLVSTYGPNHRNLVHPVHAGQSIAEVGNRGKSTGPHLHFQLDETSEPIDPAAFYQQQDLALCN